MLTYLLAIGVGLGSFALYMAAFFFPELHRRYDLIWSGVGLFYAFTLWHWAGQIRGGVLLGQMASVALMGWFTWQALALRWEQTPIEQRTQVSSGSDAPLSVVVQEQAKQLWAYLQSDEFQARLPESVKQLPAKTSERLDSLKDAAVRLWTTSLKAPPDPDADVHPTGDREKEIR